MATEQQKKDDEKMRKEIDRLEAECSFAKISEPPENVKHCCTNRERPL